MRVKNKRIYESFLEVSSAFPFKDYMENNYSKYETIISKIITNYPTESKILSIGSGPCDLEAIISRLNYDVTAVDDLSDQWHLIGKNQSRIQKFAREMDINFKMQSLEDAQLNNNYYDVVLLIDIIEHLHGSPRDLINSAVSALKQGGLLIIETPNSLNLKNRINVLLGKSNQVDANFIFWNVGDYRSHFREYTNSELFNILNNYNLVDLNIETVNMQTEIAYLSIDKMMDKIVILLYMTLSGIYPSFKDTLIASGKKPKDWKPVITSVKKFQNYYRLVKLYNLDKIPEDNLNLPSITSKELSSDERVYGRI